MFYNFKHRERQSHNLVSGWLERRAPRASR